MNITRNSIRRALRAWAKTSKLGQTELARLQVVEQTRMIEGLNDTNAGNGLALRSVLQTAIEELRPTALVDQSIEDVAGDPAWRPYILIVEQFTRSRSTASVQALLGIQDALYFQLQRQALERLVDILSRREHESEARHYVPTPLPAGLPETDHFIGRQRELADYHRQLTEQGYVVITGFPGVGKSMLASQLAMQFVPPGQIFWHNSMAQDGLETMLFELAGFLAAQGKTDLWRELMAPERVPESLADWRRQAGRVIRWLSQGDYLLCIDDFHLIEADAAIADFLVQIHRHVAGGRLKLVIISRSIPSIFGQVFVPLAGLNRFDAGQFLQTRKVDLEAEPFDQLLRLTHGNPALMNLAASILSDSDDTSETIRDLTASNEIEHFLYQSVDRSLTSIERIVVGLLALLGERGCQLGLIEASLDKKGLQSILRGLVARSLVVAHRSEKQRWFQLHALLQHYFEDGIFVDAERQVVLRRAGDYYRDRVLDPLSAAHCYMMAGDVAAAIALSADVWPIINRGQAVALSQLLQSLTHRSLSSNQWIQLHIALGTLDTYLQLGEQARVHLQSAERELELADDVVDRRRQYQLQICRGMAVLLRHIDPREAYTWITKALDLEGELAPADEGDLLTQLSGIQRRLGQTVEAQATIGRAHLVLPKSAFRLRMIAFMTSGNLALRQGRFQGAVHFYQQALHLADRLDRRADQLQILLNLSVMHKQMGDWVQAIAECQDALTLADELVYHAEWARSKLTLGVLMLHTGQFEIACSHLEDARASAAQESWHEIEIAAQNYLVEAYIEIGQLITAHNLASESLATANNHGFGAHLPFVLLCASRISSIDGDFEAASADAKRALELAESQAMISEMGAILRQQGDIALATGQITEAEHLYRASLAHLADEPFEKARTQLCIGKLTHLQNRPTQAMEYLLSARATFENLGANAELARTTQFLTEIQ